MTDCTGQQSVNSKPIGHSKPLPTIQSQPLPTKVNINQTSSVVHEIKLSSNPGISLVIPIKVHGINTHAVVDTAAQVSILSDELFDKLKHPTTPCKQVLLRGAGKCSKIIANKFPKVPLIIGDQNY